MYFFWPSVEYHQIFDVLSMSVKDRTQPWCRIFDSYLFQSVTKNLQKRLNIRHILTLEASAFWRAEVSKSWKSHRISDTYRHLKGRPSNGLKCRRHGKAIGGFLKSIEYSMRKVLELQQKRWLTVGWRCWSFNKTIGTSLEKRRLVVELTKKILIGVV